MSFPAGTRLSRYEIRSPIGAGGMGEVYLAEDTRLRRDVVLKILPAEVVSNRERLLRFEQEARATSSLNHPNIITIFEIGEERGIHFIVTEFIKGDSLRQFIGARPIELSEILNIALQLASALAAAHEAEIVHRDIKPENIMVRHDRIVKVLDFGLAKLANKSKERVLVDSKAETDARVMTTPGVVMGTVLYMSPEQARGLPRGCAHGHLEPRRRALRDAGASLAVRRRDAERRHRLYTENRAARVDEFRSRRPGGA